MEIKYSNAGTVTAEKTVEDMIDIGIQVNGRVRGNVKIARDADKDTAIAAAKPFLTKLFIRYRLSFFGSSVVCGKSS